MPKLIEVQAAKEFADTFLPDIFFKMAVHRALDAVPVVDLVHCKECRHYNTGGCAAGFGWCEAWDGGRRDEFFCNFGERNESYR